MKIKYIQILGNEEFGRTSVIWFPYKKISSTVFCYTGYYSADILYVNNVSIYTESQISQDLDDDIYISSIKSYQYEFT